MRAAKAAAERRIALIVVGVIALACVVGAVTHAQIGSAHAATPNAAVATGTVAHTSLACPFNGCTSSACHARTKDASSKSRSVASAKSSGSHKSVKTASQRSRSTTATKAQASSGSSASSVAAKARVTASAASARRSVAMAASAKAKAPSKTTAKAKPKKTSSAKPASKKRTQATGVITIETFGYKFAGPPSGCKFVADVRNIQAGNFAQTENGLMASVRNRVMATAAAKTWHQTLVTKWLPKLKSGDKVAIGCARGHHRSVSLAVVFAADLRARGFTVNLVNRDIHKTW